MTNADKFKSLFGLYATELWSMPEKDFLEWLNSEAMNCSESPNGWIPCTPETMPEENDVYLVYAPNYTGGSSSAKENHKGVMFSKYRNGKWSIEHGYHKRPNCVRAWMPVNVPEPYQPKEES